MSMSSMKWDLDKLYTSIDSLEYKKDKDTLKELIDEENILAKDFKVDDIESYLKLEEKINILAIKMFNYSSLKTSTNINDSKSYGELASLQMIFQKTVASNVAFTRFLNNVDIDQLVKENSFLIILCTIKSGYLLIGDVKWQ